MKRRLRRVLSFIPILLLAAACGKNDDEGAAALEGGGQEAVTIEFLNSMIGSTELESISQSLSRQGYRVKSTGGRLCALWGVSGEVNANDPRVSLTPDNVVGDSACLLIAETQGLAYVSRITYNKVYKDMSLATYKQSAQRIVNEEAEVGKTKAFLFFSGWFDDNDVDGDYYEVELDEKTQWGDEYLPWMDNHSYGFVACATSRYKVSDYTDAIQLAFIHNWNNYYKGAFPYMYEVVLERAEPKF